MALERGKLVLSKKGKPLIEIGGKHSVRLKASCLEVCWTT